MDGSTPIVTLQLMPEGVSQALTELVAWCIQESHAFFYTAYDDGHMEVEIRSLQQRVLMRLVLHSLLLATSMPAGVPQMSGDTLPAESAALIQRLLQLGTAL